MAIEQTRNITRIMIVDDHPPICEALTMHVSRHDDMQVCGVAHNAADALRLVDSLHPDVAVVDISLKNDDGIDLITRIRDRQPGVRMIVWSTYQEQYYADRSLKAGAMAFINKDQATEKIIEVIRQVRDGHYYLSDTLTQRLLGQMAKQNVKEPAMSVAQLSNREMQVFRQIGQGRNTRHIAELMHVSQNTVETYRNRIRTKLELRDTSELIHFATRWVLENQSE